MAGMTPDSWARMEAIEDESMAGMGSPATAGATGEMAIGAEGVGTGSNDAGGGGTYGDAIVGRGNGGVVERASGGGRAAFDFEDPPGCGLARMKTPRR